MADFQNEDEARAAHKDYPTETKKDFFWTKGHCHARVKSMLDEIPQGASILDLGCNDGSFSEALKKRKIEHKYHGLDMSSKLINIAKSRGISAEVIDVMSDGMNAFYDNSFDYVSMGEILEHVYDYDGLMALAYRICKFAVIGTTPHPMGKWGKSEGHKYHTNIFSQDEMLKIFDKLKPDPIVKLVEIISTRNMKPTWWYFKAVKIKIKAIDV